MSELLKSEPTRLQPLWNEEKKEELREVIEHEEPLINAKQAMKNLIESQSDCV